MEKIEEIGRIMDMIELMPIEFTIQPPNIETNEEAVCKLIADVLQHRTCLADDGGYNSISKRKIEEAVYAELREKTRDIGDGFTTSKKLVMWLSCYPDFCCSIDPTIRQKVKIFLEMASNKISTFEERQKMLEEACKQFNMLSPEKQKK